ncbi:MAG: zinc-binding dehydrogenase [Rhodobiaceae bacterium]|nr:zinc-binding dehydrogenase [Rhodobiaceae bacterium]
MKAAVIEKQGGLDGLVYRDWPDPEAGPGEILVRVRACGLNHLDIFVRRGMPGFPVPLPFISGGDIAGEVAALGDGVTGFKVGDRVLLNPSTDKGMLGEQLPGGMAELVAAPATHAVPIPQGVSFREAACLPVAYGTARRMMLARGKVQPGETVLVLGASGGVGNGCVQIGRNIGAKVIAAAGDDDKLEQLKEMGATHLINYKTQDFSREAWAISGKTGLDVVINFTGGDTWAPSLRTLRKGGRLITCGATAGFDPKTDIRYIWVRELNILGSDGWTTEDIRALLADVKVGLITPVISHVLPLSQAREAEELIEDRGIFGKVILEP